MQREKQEAKSQRYMLDKSQDEICLQIQVFLRTKNKIKYFSLKETLVHLILFVSISH